MSIISGDYIPVSLDILKSGMVIDYSIYREKNREFFLLCKDAVLTEELLDRFRMLTEPYNEIYIPSNKYDEIIKERNNQKDKVKKRIFFRSYEQAKKSAAKMLERIAAEDSIPAEIAEELSQTVNKQVETMEISHIIQGINSVRKIDEYLHTHSVNVALLNGVMGRWLKLEKQELAALVKVGLFHDIGKLKIPKAILDKPTKLTEQEFDLVSNHPIYSHDLLKKSGFTDERILTGVIQHHERVNGMGYPFGLNINKISEFARITSIADVYDAMITKRTFKSAHSPFEVLSWFSDGCYSELDYNYVMVFLESMVDEFKGKKVLLSNGKTGTVMFVHSTNFAYPIVQADGEIIHTSKDLKCVSLVND
ncbi:MAG: HD-GYP domain-containing protein [Oscillospiraceae bacterium]|nr:HD-GYP domain-containing protein [Oscillospiraceae bacterium]